MLDVEREQLSRMNDETPLDIFVAIQFVDYCQTLPAIFPKLLFSYRNTVDQSKRIIKHFILNKISEKFKPHPLRSDQINFFHTKDLVYYKIIQKQLHIQSHKIYNKQIFF